MPNRQFFTEKSRKLGAKSKIYCFVNINRTFRTFFREKSRCVAQNGQWLLQNRKHKTKNMTLIKRISSNISKINKSTKKDKVVYRILGHTVNILEHLRRKVIQAAALRSKNIFFVHFEPENWFECCSIFVVFFYANAPYYTFRYEILELSAIFLHSNHFSDKTIWFSTFRIIKDKIRWLYLNARNNKPTSDVIEH